MTTETWPRLRQTATDGEVDLERDRELVAIAQAGDKAAFDLLYGCYFERLERYCQRRLRDPHEAEDVTQEAFLRAWRALPTFGGERRFYPWLSVIASNLCTDVLRRRQRFGPVPLADPGERETSTVTSAEDFALASADLDLAGQAFARLSERHRRVLDLRERSGLSYQDIAQREGIRVTTVETLIWRARQAFKREFQALSGSEGSLAGIPVAVLGIGFLRRMLRATGRAATNVGSRLSAAGPQAVVASVGGAVATAALVVASASGGAHPHVPAASAGTEPAAVTTGAAPGQMIRRAGAARDAGHAAGSSPAASNHGSTHAVAGASGTVESPLSGTHAGGDAVPTAVHGQGTGSDPVTGPGPGQDLVKKVDRAVGDTSGVLGDTGKLVTNLENTVGNVANEAGTAVSGVARMLGGDLNDAVAALKSAHPIASLGQVVGSLGSPASPGPAGPGVRGGSTASSAASSGPASFQDLVARSGGLLGDLFG